MKKINLLLIILMSMFTINQSAAGSIFSKDLQGGIDAFYKSCEDEDVAEIYKDKERPNRLLLIDATDPLTAAQVQYLRDNYINGIDWQNKGEIFSMVLLDNKDISKLSHITVCSPIREDQITWTMAKKVEKKKIRQYKRMLNAAFDVMVKQNTKADSTRLIETLYQIYTNKRFNFLEGKRSLLIASDLMQISKEVDLRCKGRCPTFADTKKKKQSWLNITKLALSKNDLIELYYFQTKCRVNLATLKWWQDYFVNEGIPKKNLFAKAENGVSDISCDGKPISQGSSSTGGPIIFQQPQNGMSGFTSVK